MTKSAPKSEAPQLIHHPSAVLDDLCVYGTQHQAWCDFDRHLTEELAKYEAQHRSLFTPQAVRKSLGR